MFEKPAEVGHVGACFPKTEFGTQPGKCTPETVAGDGMSLGVSSRSTELSPSPPAKKAKTTVHEVGGEEDVFELSNKE